MQIADWEVIGPQGEFYGRYKDLPGPEKIPIYAMMRELGPWSVTLGQAPEDILKRLIEAQKARVAVALGASALVLGGMILAFTSERTKKLGLIIDALGFGILIGLAAS